MTENITNRAGEGVPRELRDALNQMFYAVLRVNPASDTVLILQSRDRPEHEWKQLNWSAHLDRYAAIMTEQGAAKLQEQLTSRALLARIESGERNFSIDSSYMKGHRTNWVTVSVSLCQDAQGVWCAYIFIRQNNEEHLLRSIIDLYVYNTCDYFIYLDMQHNSYVMLSGSTSGTPLPPAVCEDYDTAIVDYARAFVVPEDQEMVIEKMKLSNVRRQLEKKDVYSFTAGVIDSLRGYTRKQLCYRYYDRKAQIVLLTRTDVTEVYLEEQARWKELQAARIRAETDPLTELLNYGGIKAQVEKALKQRNGHCALLFIDLDNFKQVNDVLGHQEGDKLLWKIAQIFLLQTEETDLCGRVGGDEFLVFLPHIRDRKQAETCARHICEAVSCLSMPGDTTDTISCSIGGAITPEDGADYQSLVSAADRRAYEAKRRGKNTFQFEG